MDLRPRPALTTSRWAVRARAVRRLGMATLAGALLVTTAVPAQATPAGTPVGNLESVTADASGLKLRGWAWDKDTSKPAVVTITVAGKSTQLTANGSRPDVARTFPAAGADRGFEAVVPLPAGTHDVCVTVENVGAGADRSWGCRTVTAAGSSPAPAPAPAVSTGRKLSWAPPQLSNPTTITVSNTKRHLSLTAGRDYIVKMPSTPLEAKGGLHIGGGRNVVLIGGEIKISQTGTKASDRRGLYLKGQSGTIHIEGLKITGGALAEGINLDQRNGATVQLQNVRIDTVHGSKSGLHADVLQTWAGPTVLRVDGLTGYTTYQGFFLTPLQYGPGPKSVDLRNVNLVGQPGSKYLMWRDGGSGSWPITMRNVWAQTSQSGAPRHQYLKDNGTNPWAGVQSGKPAGGDIVPAGLAGTRYVSPGYQ